MGSVDMGTRVLIIPDSRLAPGECFMPKGFFKAGSVIEATNGVFMSDRITLKVEPIPEGFDRMKTLSEGVGLMCQEDMDSLRSASSSKWDETLIIAAGEVSDDGE